MSSLPDISHHFHEQNGFCHPDWNAIAHCIEGTIPEKDWHSAWESAARIWLDRLRIRLGDGYQIHETPQFMLLSEAPMRVIKDACRSYEDSLKRIMEALDGVASDEGYGKHVVLMFSRIDDYYGYITHFYPEGEHPMSGGVCLEGDGYRHFAFPTTDYSSYRTVLVHELTHACLSHLPIPTWLNEAVAMRMEQAVCDTNTFHLDREVYDKHIAHWNKRTIQQFWSGESWQIPGDSFELSYNLAQILWQKIEIDLAAPRAAILRFIIDAHADDAGESACHDIFGLSLGELVMDFLGDGDWAPDPCVWPGELFP